FNLSQNGYNEERGQQFISRLSERIATLPGVEAVSFARIVAFSDAPWVGPLFIPGSRPQPVNTNAVGPNYFKTVGTTLVHGREFTINDTPENQPVVIVNEAAARRYWQGQDALGQRIVRGNQTAEVVGIVRNSREKGLFVEPQPTLFV